jgi:hypothetical protein
MAVSALLLASSINFNIPSSATVLGISTSFAAQAVGTGTPSINIELALNGAPIGSYINVPIGSSLKTYTQGSSAFQWGTTLTPAIVDGSSLGILLQAELDTSGTSAVSSTFSVNNLSVSVYYTTSLLSEILQVETFSFAVPATSGISGIGVSFVAYSSLTTNLSVQMIKAEVPVGTPKSVTLSSTPTIYTIGASNDLWGTTWISSDINNTGFGVQITGSGVGTTFAKDLDILAYLTPSLADFLYVKTYEQNNGQITTLALDDSGIMWKEDVNNNPNVLSTALVGIIPGSYAKSATADNQEYIMFSDLSIGTERPRVLSGNTFYPLSQVGPGAPPSFQASIGSISNILSLSHYSLSGNVVTFTYTGTMPTVGSIYILSNVVSYLNGQSVIVLSTGLSPTTFEVQFQHPDDIGSAINGTATPTFSYSIQSITQPVPYSGIAEFLWSAGPGQTSPGSTVTVYYKHDTTGGQDPGLSSTTNPVYVNLAHATGGAAQFNGTWLVNGTGLGNPPGVGGNYWYFTFTYTASGSYSQIFPPGNPVSYQITLATLTTSTPIPNLTAGSPITITGVTPTGWNSNWTIVTPLTSGVLNISGTQMDASGNASYTYNVQSGAGPLVGEIVTVTNCTNAAIFNATGVISSVAGGIFQIAGFPPNHPIPFAFEANGVGSTFGTQFTFDPGAVVAGTTGQSIFGNAGSGGKVTIVGSSIQPLGAGTRQAVVFFITQSGLETAVSPPVTFTTSSNANELEVTNIPIGPPNVIARGIAITEAGANGVPGASFYVIPNNVVLTVGNTVTTYPSTIIRDNITTSAKLSFTDAVLLSSQEIDVQGNNLFNLIELGSSAWCLPYASRMFYGMQLNKVDNFNNLTFDGGYLPNPGGNLFPLGWIGTDVANTNLINSPVTGMSLYIKNAGSTVKSGVGLVYQTAYTDPYQVPIILPNTLYSVRVAASNPSGNAVGSLVIDLTDFNTGIGFGITYGTFSVLLASMSTNTSVFTGALLTTPFTQGVSPALQLRVSLANAGPGADVQVDRIEVFPTLEPYLLTQVYGSYIDNLEAIDASGSGGIINTASENSQTCTGGFVMHDIMYLLKTNSLYSTQDIPTSEPGGWSLREVSNKAGSIGIHSYSSGEEWAVMACRAGIYGFNGGQPVPINWEIRQIWEAINWDAGKTIVLRNDVTNKMMYCAIPLPTGTDPVTGITTKSIKWLPFAPYNPAPISPNVMLVLNYQAMDSFEELIGASGIRTTMFGTLAAVDMKRKWTIWQIPSPYMDFIMRPNGIDTPLFVCNGIDSSKIYEFEDNQFSDDGTAIFSLYTTYGHVNAAKSATIPLFGYHAKRYTVFQVNAKGSGNMQVRVIPNVLEARYPYTIPGGINLFDPANDDAFRPLNIKGNRVFLEFSTNAVGSWFQVSKSLLTGKADPWSSLNPTGGLNTGIK